MSEFKGTPAPWTGNISGDNASIDIILPNNTTISVDRQDRYNDEYVIERTEMEANAKLISKAPEMLEWMIKKYEKLNSAELNINSEAYKDYLELKQLIKEATE
ncbi:hypothetical protein [Elizabethkingia meningoseptica]|uniref:hypothetical protein n=1 Tax=Elizabethkingia meningoseptica TaxID=238 RepID=UPI00162A54FF|nr:hypothetical protein [Elizabethkingia meningoseptica]